MKENKGIDNISLNINGFGLDVDMDELRRFNLVASTFYWNYFHNLVIEFFFVLRILFNVFRW